MSLNKLLCVLPLAALLGACGGGYGDAAEAADGATLNAVPLSAVASPEAYTRYAGSVPASDMGEPLDLHEAQTPTSDSSEPLDLT